MCAVPNMAVLCSSLISRFPSMFLSYFRNYFEMVLDAPFILLLSSKSVILLLLLLLLLLLYDMESLVTGLFFLVRLLNQQ
jgi:hypothetical protein